MAIIGIDLGTTNSLACVWRNGGYELIPNSIGGVLTPSVVSINEKGEILTGMIAKERLITHPKDSAERFKLFIGSKKEYVLREKKFRSEDLSAFILKQLKFDAEAYLGEEVDEAVISVPAYFNDVQRSATKDAGKLAGLKVERIINEPSAAAVAHQKQCDCDGVYLVIDFGGGTLDVSIVEMFMNIVDIVAIAGDNRLGGGDIDQCIYDAFIAENPDMNEPNDKERVALLKMAEQCKTTLTTQNSASMMYQKGEKYYTLQLDNQKLTKVCAPILVRMRDVVKRALKDAGRPINSIDDVILVGGSCHMPVVKQYVEFITKKKSVSSLAPDKIVAVGAGLVSGIKSRSDGIKDMVLTDLCPFTLGIGIYSEAERQERFSPIIQRNTPLPASREGIYNTIRDNQREIKVEIYQGESVNPSENLLLGELSVSVPAMPAGKAEIKVRFTYDINGILEVEVTSLVNGSKQNKVIVSNDKLSESELELRLQELKAYKTPPRDEDKNRLLVARAERLYEEHSGYMRDIIYENLKSFNAILTDGFPAQIAKAQSDFRSFLDGIDKFNDGLLDMFEGEIESDFGEYEN